MSVRQEGAVECPAGRVGGEARRRGGRRAADVLGVAGAGEAVWADRAAGVLGLVKLRRILAIRTSWLSGLAGHLGLLAIWASRACHGCGASGPSDVSRDLDLGHAPPPRSPIRPAFSRRSNPPTVIARRRLVSALRRSASAAGGRLSGVRCQVSASGQRPASGKRQATSDGQLAASGQMDCGGLSSLPSRTGPATVRAAAGARRGSWWTVRATGVRSCR